MGFQLVSQTDASIPKQKEDSVHFKNRHQFNDMVFYRNSFNWLVLVYCVGTPQILMVVEN